MLAVVKLLFKIYLVLFWEYFRAFWRPFHMTFPSAAISPKLRSGGICEGFFFPIFRSLLCVFLSWLISAFPIVGFVFSHNAPVGGHSGSQLPGLCFVLDLTKFCVRASLSHDVTQSFFGKVIGFFFLCNLGAPLPLCVVKQAFLFVSGRRLFFAPLRHPNKAGV